MLLLPQSRIYLVFLVALALHGTTSAFSAASTTTNALRHQIRTSTPTPRGGQSFLNLLPTDFLNDAAAASASISSSSVTTAAALGIVGVSPEPIHTAFSVATFLPQPFWLLMILFPNQPVTKKIMGGLEVPLLCCLVHFFIVVASIVTGGSEATAPLAEFNDVFDPSGDPQAAFMSMTTNYPNFVSEEWSHVLTWDLFVGRYIWLDGLKRNVFTPPAVLFCNLIGPPGLLIHWLACALSEKPIFDRTELFAIVEAEANKLDAIVEADRIELDSIVETDAEK